MRPLPAHVDRDVRSIILFGSQARGDADGLSDCDVCVFTEPVDYPQLLRIRDTVARAFDTAPNAISAYPAPLVQAMATKGSLFLWHLRLEAEILADRGGFARMTLARLAPFSHYADELRVFEELLQRVRDGFESDLALSAVDLHFLQSIIRNTCVLLTHAVGKPTFGRQTAVSEASRLWPALPVVPDLYDELCAWHIEYMRGFVSDLDPPDLGKARRILELVDETLRFAREVLV